MTEPGNLLRAQAEARAAREALTRTLHDIQFRLSPKVLADDAWQTVRERGADLADETVALAKRQPAGIAAGAAVVVGLLARRPILSALGRLFSRSNETGTTVKGSGDADTTPTKSTE